MKFFRQLFRSPEVKALVAELRLIESKLEKESNKLGGYQFVKPTIWEAVANSPKILTEQIRSGSQPRELAFNLILNALLQEIGSGRNHVYRGSLSMVGSSMRGTFYWVLKQSEAEGFYSSEDVKRAEDTLKEYVRGGG